MPFVHKIVCRPDSTSSLAGTLLVETEGTFVQRKKGSSRFLVLERRVLTRPLVLPFNGEGTLIFKFLRLEPRRYPS